MKIPKGRNFNIKEFKHFHSGNWQLNSLCPRCGKILTEPLKLFTDCFLDLGVTGDEELTKTCEEYRDTVQKLWGLIAKHKFKFIDEEDFFPVKKKKNEQKKNKKHS